MVSDAQGARTVDSDDLVVFMTNNTNCPIIFIRPGKDVWLPKPNCTTFTHIVDIAFLGDIFHGIIRWEDLLSFHVDFDGNGVPIVINIKCIIQNPMGGDNSSVRSDDKDEETTSDENVGAEEDKDDYKVLKQEA